MLYIIKIEPSENNFHPFESQSHRTKCWLDGYIAVPPELVPDVVSSGGFCDLTIEDGVLVGITPTQRPEPPTPPSVEENPDQPIDPEAGESQKTYAEKLDSLTEENTLLKAQIKAQTDRSDFLEDCIAEMAMLVYAE